MDKKRGWRWILWTQHKYRYRAARARGLGRMRAAMCVVGLTLRHGL
jgi:hypothetical protein